MSTDSKKWYLQWWGQLFCFACLLILLLFFLFFIYLFSKNKEGSSNIPRANLSSENQGLNSFGDPVIGARNPRVVIYEFSDFGCPFCRQFSFPLKKVLADYSETVAWVYKDFPITKLHPGADFAAEAAQCAHEQSQFLEMHDLLFENQTKAFNEKNLLTLGEGLDLNFAEYRECLLSRRYKSEVESDLREGAELGVTATPTLFINGRKIEGALSESVLREQIENTFLEK